MLAMRVTLPAELQRFIEEKVRTGQYEKAGDVVLDALMAMRAQERWTPTDIGDLRKDVQDAVQQIKRGETSNWTAASIKAQGQRILAARKAKAVSGRSSSRRTS